MKARRSVDVSYLTHSVDGMIYDFMEKNSIPGLTLAIVQAPYIPRVVGYGLSDTKQKRLATPNTLWSIGVISEAFTAVAIMQLYEEGLVDLTGSLTKYIVESPASYSKVNVLSLLRHTSGIIDYRQLKGFDPAHPAPVNDVIALLKNEPLKFNPGEEVERNATNFLLLSEIIARVSGTSYHDFVKKGQIDYLGLKHTYFEEDLHKVLSEDVSKSNNTHELFKKDLRYINPTEVANSYDDDGNLVSHNELTGLPGFSDLWASSEDISHWDIALAGDVLIHSKENRLKVYASWKLNNGDEAPGVAGWQFYKHRGLMDIKGSARGYSSFLSRFTDSNELVCVTLLANKGGIDFTNLARKIAAGFGDLMSTGYDDNELYLLESQFPVDKTVLRLESLLKGKGIPLFAKFDHAINAKEVGLPLRPTTVLVFGSPRVGTPLMEIDQSLSLELPLKIAIWEDESGSTWLGFHHMETLASSYGLANNKTIKAMETLLEDLVRQAGNLY